MLSQVSFPLSTASIAALVAIAGQVEATIDYQAFQNPSAKSRPRFRYWIPDASVNVSQVAADIADAGRIGAGGVEILPYYNYGDIEIGPIDVPVDWTVYGWGTPAWRTLQDTALQATKDNNLIIDFAMGPNQGAGVPASYNSDGLQWDLQPFNVSIPSPGSYSARLPGWGSGPLVSASTGLVTSSSVNGGYTVETLSTPSLKAVKDQVGENGEITLQLAATNENQHYVLFAYYLIHTGYREQQTPTLVTGASQSPVEYFWQNGSFLVDHYSTEGAKTIASFWDNYLLNGSSTAEHMREVGSYVWEDSQEYPYNLLWTRYLPELFESNCGYSIEPYLPTLFGGAITYQLDDPAASQLLNFNYRETLTELNGMYLKAVTQWARSIGVRSSAQVVYDINIDMLANVPDVDAPECESLAFYDNIDAYRQYVGPADLAGKNIISSECGAVRTLAYQQTFQELVWQVHRSVAGGVNNFIFHGYPFSGNYPLTTWPGYTTFTYNYSEMHSRHMPAWDFYPDFMNFTARLQYVEQSGIPKVDLAFYQKSFDYAAVGTSYQPTNLQDAGYTYEYLSPDDFSLPAAIVSNGVLAPTRQAFKSLILRAGEPINNATIAKLCAWAQGGLPIFITDGLPTFVNFTDPNLHEDSAQTLEQLLNYPSVHQVSASNLEVSIGAAGIAPRTLVPSTSAFGTSVYTRWRESSNGSEVTVFVYNDASDSNAGEGTAFVNVAFESIGTPYTYNAWTGARHPIRIYTQTHNTTTIPIILGGNQSTIIAFEHGSTSETRVIDSTCSLVVHESGSQANPQTILSNTATTACTVKLSDDRSLQLPGSTAPFTLGNWTLTIESWTAPSNLSDIEGTVKTNTTYQIPSLLSWRSLNVANLTTVSGRGYYKTQFSWQNSSSDPTSPSGAVIDLGYIIHTAVLYVNQKKAPPLDINMAKADITQYLVDGVNEIEIVVSTPYGNALYPHWDNLRSVGQGPPPTFFGQPTIVVRDYGLVHDVRILPYCGRAI